MSQNIQNPYFYTLDASTFDVLDVVGATSISIFNSGDDVTSVSNFITNQSINIPSNLSLDLNPDSGNTLQTLRIEPQGTNIAYVVMIGGTAQLV